MKITLVYCIVILYLNSCDGFPGMGYYIADVKELSDLPEVKQEKVQYHFFMKRISKTQTIMAGKMEVMEKIGPIAFKVDVEKDGNGGYKPFLLDAVKVNNLCMSEEMLQFFGYFNGTRESFLPGCYLPPMTTFLEVRDVDKMVHQKADKMIYGKFRVKGYVMQADEVLVGFEVIIKFNEDKKKNKSFF